MHLLIIILHREDLLDEVLSGLVEMEITGADVLEGTSMERVLSEDVPIFAGLTAGGMGHIQTILAPLHDRSLLDPLCMHFKEIGVDFTEPEVGRLFVIPADFYLGPEAENQT